jgi:uncharacterized membrane protein YcaP (DUF421 family)
METAITDKNFFIFQHNSLILPQSMNIFFANTQTKPMSNIIIRVFIIYVVVIFVMRLMGKRQIGEMEPFELVITLIIADLATIPMAEQTIPIWYGVVPLLVIAIVHFAFSFMTKKSPIMRDVISGKPIIVIDPQGIDFKELKKLDISAEELLESLRNLDYFDISEINYAIIERTGKISVIPKTSAIPVTREDMRIVKPENEVFYCIVENGKIIGRNFGEMGLRQEVVMTDITHNMLCEQKDLAFCAMSEGGNVTAQKKNEKAVNFKIKIGKEHYTEKALDEKREDKTIASIPDKICNAPEFTNNVVKNVAQDARRKSGK